MRSWSFFQFSTCRATRRNFVSSCLSRMGMILDADELERLIELLQVINEEMRPRPIHGLLLTNDAFLEIEAPLPPAENLCYGRLSYERTKDRMSHCSLLQIDFAIATPGLERETPASLAQTAHLQNFRRRELIQISDQRVAWIDSFRRCAWM